MIIENILHELRAYYHGTRQIGHSTLMNVGTNNYNKPKRVLVLNRSHGDTMGLRRSEMVDMGNLERLRGIHVPLVIDNGALLEIFDQTVLKYGELQSETDRQRAQYLNKKHELDISEGKIKEMRSQPFKTFFKTIFKLWRH
jgi:hypothetical protein